MKWTFDARIQRATELAELRPAARDLLGFYRELLVFQKPIFDALQSRGETDVRALASYFPRLFDLVAQYGPAELARQGKARLAAAETGKELLSAAWQDGVAHTMAADPYGRFYARVLLQPYAEYLASRADVRAEPESRTCPFCSSWPVAGVLRGEGDGGKRWLLCAVCSTEWPFRRVLCWNCGEENKDKLPVYKAEQFAAVRVDGCDTCHVYIKSVDMTVDGRAVPMVDEIAAVALDIWAEEHGYGKLETNLLGM
ncbi:MAG TPA: formate dehydrogenase accessory protein FdhE [Bryobacteraceae bacterium]|nr:formate dehydrogenase accessory protein FdhE [Bryobacteraceae bacterium]